MLVQLKDILKGKRPGKVTTTLRLTRQLQTEDFPQVLMSHILNSRIYVRVFSALVPQNCRRSLACLCATFPIVLLALLGDVEGLIDEKFKYYMQMYAMTHSEQCATKCARITHIHTDLLG